MKVFKKRTDFDGTGIDFEALKKAVRSDDFRLAMANREVFGFIRDAGMPMCSYENTPGDTTIPPVPSHIVTGVDADGDSLVLDIEVLPTSEGSRLLEMIRVYGRIGDFRFVCYGRNKNISAIREINFCVK